MLFQAIPVLHVPRIADCKAFYGDFLGFRCNWGGEMEAGTDELPGYALLFRDDIEIHLAEQRAGVIQGSGVLIRMRGIDALHRELCARNSGFTLSKVSATQWASRVFFAVDPFGNRLRFWENDPGSVEE